MSETTKTISLEKTNLEAHVDLCAERYNRLETRLDMIEKRLEDVSTKISSSHGSMIKVLVGSAATVIAGLLSTVVVLLISMNG